MRIILLLFLLMSATTRERAFAASFGGKKSSGVYAGIGFGYTSAELQPTGQPKSTFGGSHGVVELGANIKFTTSFGMNLAAEYKSSAIENTIESSNYMEKAEISSTSGKLGFYWRDFTIGGGYSSTAIDVKNVSSSAPSQIKTFEGSPTTVFVNYGFENELFRTVLEVQHSFGNFDEMKYGESSLGLRLFLMF